MGNTPYPITEIFAWVVDDPSGTHGILGVIRGDMPMQGISARRELMDTPEMRAVAAGAAQELGLRVHLKRFLLCERLVTVPESN